MAMSGLELALDLSRTEFNLIKRYGNPKNTGYGTCDVGLQYIPGEFGGYQTVLRKERPLHLSVAILALNSSEPEKRSVSQASDTSGTSGVSSMTSGSCVDNTSLKLRYADVDMMPIIHEKRNILDMATNVRGGSFSFFTPSQDHPNISKAIMYPENRIEKYGGSSNKKTCPGCGFEAPIDFLPNGGDEFSCLL